MVRNSADHGLESTADRVAAGKLEVGEVVLNAFHEGGHFSIQILDDGGGINTARVLEKAIGRGLVSEGNADSLTNQQILRFIFTAGFLKAVEVISVSGRGVGMDVVSTNIEKIGGTVDVKTDVGRGSVFSYQNSFDVVFCCNVLIYFGKDTKVEVLGRIVQRMPSDGVLFLGGAETVFGVSEEFKSAPGQRGL